MSTNTFMFNLNGKRSLKKGFYGILIAIFFGTGTYVRAEDSIYFSLNSANYCPEEVRDLFLDRLPDDLSELDISSYPNLKKLEVSNSAVKNVTGFKADSGKLKEVRFIHCLDLETDQVLDQLGKYHRFNVQSLTLKGASMLFVPAELTQFRNLEELDISQNGLTALPEGIGRLQKLKALNISGNNLEELPVSFGLLPVRTLEFSYNQGSLEEKAEQTLCALDQIEALTMRGWKKLPENLGEFDRLKSLNIASGSFKSIPSGYAKLANLTELNLSQCRKLAPEHLLSSFDVPKLEKLSIGHYGLSQLPKDLEKATGLKELYVNRGQFQSGSLDLSALDQLSTASFKNVRFDQVKEGTTFDQLEQSLSQSKNLENISFVNCGLTRFPVQLASLTNVESLRLNGNAITQIPENVAQKISPLLQTLNVMNNPLEYSSVARFKESSAQDIDIVYNQPRNDPEKDLQIAKNDLNKSLPEPLSQEKIRFLQRINTPIAERIDDQQKEAFKIQSGKSQQIRTANGTLFEIPKMAFLDMAGNPVNGPVEIKYVEYTNPLAILADNVDMSYTENGKIQQLISGGMFSFEAFSDGNPLKANPKEPVKVHFKTDSTSNNFDLFVYDTAGAGWKNITQTSPQSITEAKALTNEYTAFTQVDSYTVPRQKIRRVRVPGSSGRRLIIPRDYVKQPRAPRYVENQFMVTLNKRRFDRKYHLDLAASSEYISKSLKKHTYYGKIGNMEVNLLKKAHFIIEESDVDIRGMRVEMARLSKLDGIRSGRGGRSSLWLYASEVTMEPDKEKDNFVLTIKIGNKTFRIHVFPFFKSKDAGRVQRSTSRFAKNYVRSHQHTNRRKEAIRMKYDQAYQKFEGEMKAYREEMKKRNAAELKRIANRGVSRESVTRSFFLNGFGMYNCDRVYTIPEAQQIKMAQNYTNSEGNKLNAVSATIINFKAMTTFSYWWNGKLTYDRAGENALIVYLEKNQIGYLPVSEFREIATGGEHQQNYKIPLRLLTKKSVTVQELQGVLKQ